MRSATLSRLMGFYLTLLVCAGATVFGATYGGGSGSFEDPYLIATAEHLNTIGTDPNDWDDHFLLIADVDMSGYTGDEYHVVGTLANRFTGSFDGNGYVISNLTVESEGGNNYVGLFGYVAGATMTRVTLENAFIASQGRYAGGLAGYMSGGTVTDCSVSGFVTTECLTSYAYAGVLMGSASDCTIRRCRSEGEAYAFSTQQYAHAGGLTGQHYAGSMNACFSTASAIASAQGPGSTAYAGGLAGRQYGSESVIEQCYALGSSAAAGETVYEGGLLGQQPFGTLTACFWDRQTSGQETSAGGPGAIGLTTAEMMQLATFENAGWDFSTTDGDAADWMMLREGEDYPRLAWQPVYAGDIAGLYGVDLADLEELARHWMAADCPAGCEDADLAPAGGDGVVDMLDLAAMAANWLR